LLIAPQLKYIWKEGKHTCWLADCNHAAGYPSSN
jgi:hypothetical protein